MKSLVWYLSYSWERIKEQAKSVLMITLYLIVIQVVLTRGFEDWHETVLGLLSAIVGISFFGEGFVAGVLPLGDMIGVGMVNKLPRAVSTLAFFILSVACTWAEPAMGALDYGGQDVVSSVESPVLWYLLNAWRYRLLTTVGCGVGFAALIGTVRLVRGWGLKTVIYPSMVATLAMNLITERVGLTQIIGLSYDCGAVTTGAVTVPLILAIAGSVNKTVRKNRGEIIKSDDDHQTLMDAFGMVTIASLYPVILVQCLGIYASKTVPVEYIQDFYDSCDHPCVMGKPLTLGPKELLYATRSVLPLVGILIFIVKVMLGEPLPRMTLRKKNTVGRQRPYRLGRCCKKEDDPATPNFVYKPQWRNTTIATEEDAASSRGDRHDSLGSLGSLGSTKTVASQASSQTSSKGSWKSGRGNAAAERAAAIREALAKDEMDVHMVVGCCEMYVGMFLFNLGLKYGLGDLGRRVGESVPGLFLETDLPDTPYLNTKTQGVLVIVAISFFLLFIGAYAEPALNSMGTDTEKLTHGKLKKGKLMFSVAVGVGLGVTAGVLRMLYDMSLTYMAVIGYAIALVLTGPSSSEYVGIGWDAAGVTTGPLITVPLAMGLGLGTQLHLDDAFGLLTMGSVGPVLTVLSTGLVVRLLHYLLPSLFPDPPEGISEPEVTLPAGVGDKAVKAVPVKALALAEKANGVDETGDRGAIDAKSPSEIQILEHRIVRLPAGDENGGGAPEVYANGGTNGHHTHANGSSVQTVDDGCNGCSSKDKDDCEYWEL